MSWQYLDAFRRFLPGWEHSYLFVTGPQIGIREARRLKGIDLATVDAVRDGRKWPHDAIARYSWPMEDHVAPGLTECGRIRDKGWYHIPYGAICSVSTQNLWASSRLVSSDSRAYASLRVMGTSFATGHACGVSTAVYAWSGQSDYVGVRRGLEFQGALL